MDWAAAPPAHAHAPVLQIRSLGLDDPSEQPRFQDISTPSGFLRALREIVATDLAAEPVLRSLVRRFLFKYVSLCVSLLINKQRLTNIICQQK